MLLRRLPAIGRKLRLESKPSLEQSCVKGFMSYDRKKRQTDKLYIYMYVDISTFIQNMAEIIK